MTGPLLLIEADELLHTKAAGAERKWFQYNYGPGIEPYVFPKYTRRKQLGAIIDREGLNFSADDVEREAENTCGFNQLVNNVRGEIARYCDRFKTDQYELHISPSGSANFRYAIADTQPYKGRRKKQKKPAQLRNLKKWLCDNYDVHVAEFQEADDSVMIRHWEVEDSVIVARDKDFWASGRRIWNPMTDEEYIQLEDPVHQGFLKINEKGKLVGRGVCWFYAQMLLGDAVDDIPGINGMGDKTVFKEYLKLIELLSAHDVPVAEEKRMAEMVYLIYQQELKKQGEHPVNIHSRYLEVADLLWIRTKKNECKSDRLDQWIKELTHV